MQNQSTTQTWFHQKTTFIHVDCFKNIPQLEKRSIFFPTVVKLWKDLSAKLKNKRFSYRTIMKKIKKPIPTLFREQRDTILR